MQILLFLCKARIKTNVLLCIKTIIIMQIMQLFLCIHREVIMSLGNRIKQMRKILRINQSELSNALKNTTRGTISNWERDNSRPSSTHLSKMCTLFGVNLNWLLTGEGLPFKDGVKPKSNIHNIINQENGVNNSAHVGISNIDGANNKVYTENPNVTKSNTPSNSNHQSNHDIIVSLFKLEKMVEKGLLTKKEFNKIKTGVLQDL